jgi:hypothetical protein
MLVVFELSVRLINLKTTERTLIKFRNGIYNKSSKTVHRTNCMPLPNVLY